MPSDPSRVGQAEDKQGSKHNRLIMEQEGNNKSNGTNTVIDVWEWKGLHLPHLAVLGASVTPKTAEK